MKRFAKLMLVTIGFGVLGFVMSLVPQKTAKGTVAAQVNVVNTPLPVTGNVNATLTGTPTVNVANIPPVNVNFPSSIGVNGSVLVTNPITTFGNGLAQVPLLIREVDDRELAPIEVVSFEALSSGGVVSGSSPFTVPTSTRFVIDQIDGFCFTSLGNTINLSTLTFNSGGSPFTINFHLTPEAPVVILSVAYTFNLPVHYVADPGSTFSGRAFTTDLTSSTECTYNLSGHLVSLGLP